MVYHLHRTGKSRISKKVVFSSHVTSNLNINLTKIIIRRMGKGEVVHVWGGTLNSRIPL